MATPSSSSSRWCPTKQQVMILEDMYNKGGIKTPNAYQIHQITTHLSLYGKIEGKNVFYWFQNHKARERQKLRRKLMQNQKQLQLSLHHHQPSWFHYSFPSATLTPFYQGQNAERVGHQDSSTAPQPAVWPDISCVGVRVQRSFQHSNGHSPLKTLELFPLKSTHLLENNNGNPNKERTSSSSSY